MNSERTILVTGFGPFGNHPINASWEAVKELYEMRNDLHERHNVNLIIDNIPVDYDHVLNRVPQLWKEHNPQIVLHVGVSHLTKCLTIEYKAHGTGYVRADINDKCPIEKYDETTSPVLETAIDVKNLCDRINSKNTDENSCKACVSDDAGRYLCEYTYYQSLRKDAKRALFIHVPDSNVYTSKIVARGLYEIIELLVEST